MYANAYIQWPLHNCACVCKQGSRKKYAIIKQISPQLLVVSSFLSKHTSLKNVNFNNLCNYSGIIIIKGLIQCNCLIYYYVKSCSSWQAMP